ncbi:hypothetical protein [Aeromicrobium wangtongii]|uniref:hypothetical protein n=1 Tax=Aeromicrobium wangtongii TaxID=2969247 RepID=UPI002017E2B3|nr:hypothetical protein [Aeromicrobium wangtongii]MCL3817633.1 hypothetical protein [Aeromicrobium wangtongii]
MRSLLMTLAAVLLVASGCTSGSGTDQPTRPTEAVPTDAAADLAAVGVDWPRADGVLDVAAAPAAPAGFSAEMVERMAGVLTDWATATTVDRDVWHSATPVDDVVRALPAEVGASLRTQTKDSVSPGLAVANVFADEVTVIGAPAVTTAWRVSTETDDDGQQLVVLQLQTRAAYEVRLGDDAPTRVIGVLRVHGLSAYPGTTTDFGVSGGWQEFGAGDCALALDDELVPGGDVAESAQDLKAFVKIGDGDELTMPALDPDDRVDAEYLQRCRDNAT